MITKVQIKNINAINDITLSFEKSRYHYLCDNIFNEQLVNPIAFYGTNGSGKTSFIFALAQLVQILCYEPERYTMFIPNLLCEDKKCSSSIKLWFIINSKSYVYYIETHLSQGIIKEKLTMNNHIIFHKTDANTYMYKDKEETLSSTTFSILRKIAGELYDDDINMAYNYLSNIVYIDAAKREFFTKQMVQKSINDLVVEQSDEVEKILKNYHHFPLYKYVSINIDGKKQYFFKMNIAGKTKTLNAAFMSTGMINQSMMLSILTSLPKNSVMLIDEIEDALHPLTIMDFIKVVKEKNIQLLFTSHNTYILQKLRPDQIIFANWSNGYSTYKKLSDIYPNIREVNNIEKMYLSHLFDEDIESNE